MVKKLKCWRNQTTKTQKDFGGIQFIHKKNQTQASVGRYFHSARPKDWEVQITGISEARKGYPNSKVGITKKEALRRLNSYMKKHDICKLKS